MHTDDELLAKTRDPDAEPARGWLAACAADPAGEMYGLHEYTEEQSVAFVEQLFDAGAIEVWAVEIDREDRNTSEVVVELPADPAARDALFAIQRRTAESCGFDEHDVDRGQRFLWFWWT